MNITPVTNTTNNLMKDRFYQPIKTETVKQVEKIKPVGLLHIVAKLQTLPGNNHLSFSGLVLVFTDESKLLAFRKQVYDRSYNLVVEVPMLAYSYLEIAGINNESNFLDVQLPLNAKSYFKSCDESDLTGKLKWEEISKHVDLSGINTIVYNAETNEIVQQSCNVELISAEELIEESSRFTI